MGVGAIRRSGPSLGPKRKRAWIFIQALDLTGGQGRNRTIDTRIFSPLLYQLSYLARSRDARETRI